MSTRKFGGILLHGVTGSGKTAVYLAAMRTVLEAGRSAILLVPEIGLTPTVAADLHQVFGDEVAILHSALSESGARRAVASHQARGGAHGGGYAFGGIRARLRPGTDHRRRRTGLLLQAGRDAALPRPRRSRDARQDGRAAVVVLGSATPSLESYYNAKKNKYSLIELPDRVEQRPLPEVELIDMKQEFQETGQEQVDLAQAGGRNPRTART